MTATTSASTSPAPRLRLTARLGAHSERLLSGNARVRPLMLWTGAALLPVGLLTIVLGWYGTANTPYQYDQISYLVSGGLLGLGLTFAGGFLFFGAWLANVAEQSRVSSDRIVEALDPLATAQELAASGAGRQALRLVTTSSGTTLHRSDCGLVSQRPDLVPVEADAAGLTPCRVCRPGSQG